MVIKKEKDFVFHKMRASSKNIYKIPLLQLPSTIQISRRLYNGAH
jgi:hypothetical protein